MNNICQITEQEQEDAYILVRCDGAIGAVRLQLHLVRGTKYVKFTIGGLLSLKWQQLLLP